MLIWEMRRISRTIRPSVDVLCLSFRPTHARMANPNRRAPSQALRLNSQAAKFTRIYHQMTQVMPL